MACVREAAPSRVGSAFRSFQPSTFTMLEQACGSRTKPGRPLVKGTAKVQDIGGEVGHIDGQIEVFGSLGLGPTARTSVDGVRTSRKQIA